MSEERADRVTYCKHGDVPNDTLIRREYGFHEREAAGRAKRDVARCLLDRILAEKAVTSFEVKGLDDRAGWLGYKDA